MITLEMEKQCGCFKKSDYEAVQTFTSKDEALVSASKMCDDMNENFCQKHNFKVTEEGDKLIIKVEMNG
jgi:hypothetical protein